MKITEKDKKLLFIVASILIVFCAYFFGFRKITEKNDEMTNEISTLKSTYNNLKIMTANAAGYSEKTEKYSLEITDTMKTFDTGFSQPYTIMFLNEIQKETGAWISQAGLAQTEQIYTFGQGNSSNPSKKGQKAYSSDYSGYRTVLTLTYSASYSDFKTMINFINTYKYKCSIDSMTMSYNADSNIVSGSMVLNQYAVTGADRIFTQPYMDNLLNGTDNIFNSSIFTPGSNANIDNGSSILEDYDLYMTLQPVKSDSDALVIGQKGDQTGTTIITNNESSMQDVTITVSGSEGDYKIAYKVGNVTYPVASYNDGAAFAPGEMLSLLVISSERTDDNDISGAKTTLVNDSDITLNVKVVNDDENSPRFIIDQKKGDIVVY